MVFVSKERSVEALLSCGLTLDQWTAEPELIPTLCISTTGFDSGSNERVEQESKKLFQAVLTENTKHHPGTAGGSDAQAIIKSMNCTISVLFGAGGERHKL